MKKQLKDRKAGLKLKEGHYEQIEIIKTRKNYSKLLLTTVKLNLLK